MALPIDPSRSALPPVAQFLAEAALQRQTSLLGLDKAPAVHAPAGADPAAPPPTAGSPPSPTSPLPLPADKASISAQAREQLGAGFDPGALGPMLRRAVPEPVAYRCACLCLHHCPQGRPRWQRLVLGRRRPHPALPGRPPASVRR